VGPTMQELQRYCVLELRVCPYPCEIKPARTRMPGDIHVSTPQRIRVMWVVNSIFGQVWNAGITFSWLPRSRKRPRETKEDYSITASDIDNG
jgi:hypothetical protein